MSRTSILLCTVLLLGATALRAGADASPRQLETSAHQLGDPDPDVRERAAAALRAAGPAAEAALRTVAESGEPEAARRAKALLRELRQPEPEEPALPDPPELNAYRNANEDAKRQHVVQLVAGGTQHAGTVVRLWAEEQDEDLRAVMFRAMAQSPAVYATALLAYGNAPAAERMLEAALAEGNVEAAAPYAALALVRGQLDAATQRWAVWEPKGEGGEALVATVRARLNRAAGDYSTAVAAAQRSGDSALLEETLVAAGEWAALAEHLSRQPLPPAALDRPKRLGKLAGAYYLAGDAKSFDDVVARMHKLANRDTLDDVAHTLLLAGRIDDAMPLLAEGASGTIDRMRVLAARERWDDAWRLLAEHDAARDEPAMSLRVAAAEMLYTLGEDKQASELLARVAEENKPARRMAVEVLLGGAYRRMGQKDRAWEHYRAAVLAEANGQRDEKAGTNAAWAAFYVDADGDGEADVGGNNLWEVVTEKFPTDSPEQRFDRIRAVVEGKATVDDVVALADTGGALGFGNPFRRNNRGAGGPGGVAATRRYRAYASNLVRLAGQRMRDAGQADAAEQYLTKAAEQAPVPPFAAALYLHLGDWAAEKKEWAKASTAYARAWNVDRSRSMPLYQRAWALGHAGWHARAAELNELARALPLADASRRFESARALYDHRLFEPLSRETFAVLQTARHDQYGAHLVMQVGGDHVARNENGAGAGNAPGGSSPRERMFYNLVGTYDLSEPVGYLRVAHSLHRGRAAALLKAGDPAGAMREIEQCQTILPGDILLAIDVVPELERVGQKDKADAVYAEAVRVHDAVVAKYPGAANHRNDLAWLAVNCGRDLDKALAHATRAVELRPDNAAYVDTLAEVQFRRGDIDAAINTMNRCAELEPRQPRHREQLERFEAAKRGEKREMPPA